MSNKTHLDPGQLNRRVTLQKEVRTPDGAGGYVKTWKTWATTWGCVEPSSGTEPYFSDQLYPHQQYKITIRYRAGVQPGMRLLLGKQVLRIRSVGDPTYEHVLLPLQCEELQSQGAIS